MGVLFTKMNISKKTHSFSTIELIITVSIIMILGGIFLLNYGFQRDKIDLNNAASVVTQEVRKAQDLAIGQGARPPGCEPEGASTNFAVKFYKNHNYVSLYVDKDQETPSECEIEKKYFSPNIIIDKITPSPDGNTGWVSFYRENFNVKINNPTSGTKRLQIDFCIKSECTADNTKSIILNNKGMVWMQEE